MKKNKKMTKYEKNIRRKIITPDMAEAALVAATIEGRYYAIKDGSMSRRSQRVYQQKDRLVRWMLDRIESPNFVVRRFGWYDEYNGQELVNCPNSEYFAAFKTKRDGIILSPILLDGIWGGYVSDSVMEEYIADDLNWDCDIIDIEDVKFGNRRKLVMSNKMMGDIISLVENCERDDVTIVLD